MSGQVSFRRSWSCFLRIRNKQSACKHITCMRQSITGYIQPSQQVAKKGLTRGSCRLAAPCGRCVGPLGGGSGQSKWGSRMTLFVQHFLRSTPFVSGCRVASSMDNLKRHHRGGGGGAGGGSERHRRPVHQPHQRKVNICIMCSCMREPACLCVSLCVCV